MITALFILLFAVVFILLSGVFNRILFKKIESGKTKTASNMRIGAAIFAIVYLICMWLLPQVIKPAFAFSDFESYLFWTEGRKEEGLFKTDKYIETNFGYLYSIGDDMLSGLARKTDGKYKKDSLKLSMQKRLEAEDETTMLYIFANSKKDLRVFLFFGLEESLINCTVNGNQALDYSRGNLANKVCITEKQQNYTLTCNGNVFEI